MKLSVYTYKYTFIQINVSEWIPLMEWLISLSDDFGKHTVSSFPQQMLQDSREEDPQLSVQPSMALSAAKWFIFHTIPPNSPWVWGGEEKVQNSLSQGYTEGFPLLFTLSIKWEWDTCTMMRTWSTVRFLQGCALTFQIVFLYFEPFKIYTSVIF